MVSLATILDTAGRTLSVLKMLEPVLKDQPYVSEVLGVLSKVLDGARTGAGAYDKLLIELDELIDEMETIRARGPVTGNDLRNEVASVAERGARIDAIAAGYKK